ncbi:EF-hand domain-containing protein [Sphingomonas sp. MMS24-J13]|uniref:EF-hand domain-containing protein n=1 Tax=Sphingomonas sp. MMS24-J13 TaxID=3238686 RepID=UPI00384BB23A
MQFLAGAGLVVLIACAPAMAQDMPPPPGGPGTGSPGMPHSGMGGPGMHEAPAPITRAAVEKMVADHFALLDANKDGVVTRAELDAFRDKRRSEIRTAMEARMKEHQARAFDRLDTNHDGTISREEFAAATAPRASAPGEGVPPPPWAMAGPDGPGPVGHGPMGHDRMEHHAMLDHMHGPMGGPEMMMGARWFDLVVDDHGGKVTLAEAKTGALTLFDRLDVNHDGTITPDERRMAFRGMRWHGGFGRDRQTPAKGRGGRSPLSFAGEDFAFVFSKC